MSSPETWVPRLSRFGRWGDAAGAATTAERTFLATLACDRFGACEAPARPVAPAPLPSGTVAIPPTLAAVLTDRSPDRLAHAWGKSFPDIARAFSGRADHAPDLVAYPRDTDDVAAVLEWAAAAGVAVVPYGGGTSVVGGVTPDVGAAYRGTVSLDLQRLSQVLELDLASRAAHVQAGILGPDLARALQPTGLALRHYPQSYEFSTLGGWIATRAGGHYATGPTHIDDLIESVTVLSPAGRWQTRRLPASGAGPDPVRLAVGSEGALGVITDAWVRLQERPRFRASTTATFASFTRAVAAVRALVQSGLQPANLRLLDRVEAANVLVGDGSREVLVLGFESADHDVSAALQRAIELCRDHGGTVTESTEVAPRGGADAWRSAFLRMPYYRDALLEHGIISETFETAVTWDRFADLHAEISEAVSEALRAERLTPATVSCRFTHVYPDGVAPYFTVLARGRPGDLDQQWWTVKAAAMAAIEATGGTVTHHHAVGRDHMTWYRAERPDLFGAALSATREVMDPAGIMNPGVLVGR